MAKRVRKSKRFIMFEIITILLIIFILLMSLYFNKETDNKKHEYTIIQNELYLKKKELEELNNSLEDLINKEENIKNIDEEIKDIKDKYFSKLKEFETKVINNETNKKIAYLTFDDGPYYNTYKVLDILDKYDVKATFFTTTVNKQYCYDNKSYNCFLLYKEYAKRGHTIANHTYTHAIRKGLYASTESFMEALINQENHIKTYSNGYITNIVRFPGGKFFFW